MASKYEDKRTLQQSLLHPSFGNEEELTSRDSESSTSAFRDRGNSIESNLLTWILVALHIILFSAYIIVFSCFKYKTPSRSEGLHHIFSPAFSALHYEKVLLEFPIENNSFVGEPRPELNEAWHHLLRNMVIRISAQELENVFPRMSLPLADGSGYIAELGVYHQLHCVKRIYQLIHMEYYRPNLTEDELTVEKAHIDHCLEYLRGAAICHADVSLNTFFWHNRRPTSRSYSHHECVQWKLLEDWASERRVDIFDKTVIVPEGFE